MDKSFFSWEVRPSAWKSFWVGMTFCWRGGGSHSAQSWPLQNELFGPFFTFSSLVFREGKHVNVDTMLSSHSSYLHDEVLVFQTSGLQNCSYFGIFWKLLACFDAHHHICILQFHWSPFSLNVNRSWSGSFDCVSRFSLKCIRFEYFNVLHSHWWLLSQTHERSFFTSRPSFL